MHFHARCHLVIPVLFCVFSPALASVEVKLASSSTQSRKPNLFRAPAAPAMYSCEDRCDTEGHNHELPCQCNARCIEYDDCCDDYQTACLTCERKCSTFNIGFPCQCSDKCEEYGTCCDDYKALCQKGLITNDELKRLSEDFLSLDHNNVVGLVNVRLQGINKAGGPDLAPSSLLEVMPEARSVSTISKLIPLFDNYFPPAGKAEEVTAEEEDEERQFLDAIFATPIMQRLEEFLASKSVFFTRFRPIFRRIWFGMYSRSRNVLGSSAFEHVFLGELKNGVSGFHNWIYFANEEARHRLNYKGHFKTFNFCQKGQAISHTFDWLNNTKPISSMFIGSSPEFEMAIYTLCFYARPNSRCSIRLNSFPFQIQTYTMNYNGEKYIGSAYPIV